MMFRKEKNIYVHPAQHVSFVPVSNDPLVLTFLRVIIILVFECVTSGYK